MSAVTAAPPIISASPPPVQPAMPSPRPLPSPAAPPAAIPPFPIRPLTVEQFEYLVETGFYGDEKIELLDGWVVNKMTHGTLASTVISILSDILSRRLSDRHAVRIQLPIKLPRSTPEPDVAVVAGNYRDYRYRHPTAADTPVAIEVSDSTLATDRGDKLRLYAEAGLREYWVINCVDRQVEVYTQPVTSHNAAEYGPVVTYEVGDTVLLQIPGEPVIEIAVATLFCVD